MTTYYYQTHLAPIKIGFSFWLQWMFATLIGFSISLLWIEIGEKPDISMIEAIIGGGMVGLAQSFILKQHLSQAWKWIIASAIAWGLMAISGVGAIGWFAPRTLDLSLRLYYGILHGAKFGAAIGIAQWFSLRKQVPHAWIWTLLSSIFWAIALALGWSIGGILRLATHLFLAEVIGLFAVWIFVSMLTGISLVFLLRNLTPALLFQLK